MEIKNVIVLLSLFVLIFCNNIVYGENINSIENQSGYNNSSISSIQTNENQMSGNNQLNDIFLRELNLERELLAQKQQTYDSFLNTVLTWFTLFGIILAVLGFIFYKNIRDIKEDVRIELNKDLSEKVQMIIEKTMKSTYEKPISELGERVSELENRAEDFRYIEKGQKKFALYPNEREIEKKEAQSKNIFEE